MFLVPTKKDYCRRCRIVIVNDTPVGVLCINDTIRELVNKQTTLVYIGRTSDKYTDSDLHFREEFGAVPWFFSYRRFNEGQLAIVWEEDWNKTTTTQKDSIYCTCGGPTKTCDTGYSLYKVCAKCKKEKKEP